MGKTITICSVEDEVFLALKRHAESAGISIPERLRRHIRLMALQEPPSVTTKEWLDRLRQQPINSSITREHILEALDEIRGPWR